MDLANDNRAKSPKVLKGLRNVFVDETKISFLDIKNKSVIFRGYSIDQLFTSNLEDIIFLLKEGHLPSAKESKNFLEKILSGFNLSEIDQKILSNLPTTRSCIDFLEMACPFWGHYFEGINNISIYSKVNLYASEYLKKRFSNQATTPPPANTSTLNEYLWSLFFSRRPTQLELDVFTISSILYLEHGMCASTFAARVTASTGSSLYSALGSAIATMKGPLHGGAIEKVFDLIQEVENREIEIWLDEKLKKGEMIMGFGHGAYQKREDSRVSLMWPYLEKLCNQKNNDALFQKLNRLRTLMAEREVFPNVDFVVAPCLYLLDMPKFMTSAFIAQNRVVGWLAHIQEQINSNKLIRPRALYTGEIFNFTSDLC
jgi:citrate synthase